MKLRDLARAGALISQAGRSASADSVAAVARPVPILPGEQRLSVTASIEWAFS